MVTIPKSLQPPTKATTVSQQRDIKKYGSLQAAAQAKQLQVQQLSQDTSKQEEYEKALAEYNEQVQDLKAYELAVKTFNAGQAGAYVYFMDKEAGSNPQVAKTIKYLEIFLREQRAGNISPTGTQLAVEKYKMDLARRLPPEPEQPFYVDIDDVGKTDATIYTSPDKSGRTFSRNDLYIPLDVSRGILKEPEKAPPILQESISIERIEAETESVKPSQVKKTGLEPGQAVYIDIEDINKKDPTIYTSSDKSGTKFKKSEIQYLQPVGEFDTPKEVGQDYYEATGRTEFTIAIPIRRVDNDKVLIQDYKFSIKNGKVVKITPMNYGVVSVEKYLLDDARRRIKFPDFTKGDLKSEVTGGIIIKDIGSKIDSQTGLNQNLGTSIDYRKEDTFQITDLLKDREVRFGNIVGSSPIGFSGLFPQKKDSPTLIEMYSTVPEGNLNIGIGGFSYGKTGKYEFDATSYITGQGLIAGEKKKEVFSKLLEEDKVQGELDKLDNEYEKRIQESFINEYQEEIKSGKITQEEAIESYLQSNKYKKLAEQYGKDYSEKVESLTQRGNIGFIKSGKYGAQLSYYAAKEFLYGRVSTPKKIVETGAIGTAAIYGLGALPAAVGTTLNVGYLGYSSYKVLDPKSSPTEFFGGVVGVGLSGAALGYQAYRYARAPDLYRVPEGKTNIKIKSSQIIGNKEGNLVSYDEKQFLSIKARGEKTIAYEKWQSFLNKNIGTKFKPRFTGDPTEKIKPLYNVDGISTGFKYSGTSNYEKTIKWLQSYGYSKSQATAALRYTAPRKFEAYVSGKSILVDKNLAQKDFLVRLKQPSTTIDGIKTRAGPEKRFFYKVNAEKINLKGGKSYIKEDIVISPYKVAKESFKFTKDGWVFDARYVPYKQIKETRNIYASVTSGTRKAYYPIGGDETLAKAWGLRKYRDTFSFSVGQQTAPTKISNLRGTTSTRIFEKGFVQPDKSNIIKPANIKKTPLSKTFGQTDDVVTFSFTDDLDKIDDVVTSGDDLIYSLDKTDDVTGSVSQYYGKGMYERSAGGADVTGNIYDDLLSVSPINIQVPQPVTSPSLISGELVQVYSPILNIGSASALSISAITQLNQPQLEKQEVGITQTDLIGQPIAQPDLIGQPIAQPDLIGQPALIQQPALVQQPALIQQPITSPGINIPRTVSPGQVRPGDTIFLPIPIPQGKKVESKEEELKAYKAEVKTPKGYVKVTDKPHTKKGARDVLARVLDNTKSATGRMVPLKKKVDEDKLIKGDGYYKQNERKFRGFKISKGKKVPLKNTLIEKRGFRNDTPGEQRGLTVAQSVARRRKRSQGLPVRRTKKRRTPFGF